MIYFLRYVLIHHQKAIYTYQSDSYTRGILTMPVCLHTSKPLWFVSHMISRLIGWCCRGCSFQFSKCCLRNLSFPLFKCDVLVLKKTCPGSTDANCFWSTAKRTPLWKSNRNVLFIIIFDRDYWISIDCVWYVSKDPLRKIKSVRYLSAVVSRGRVMKHWKKHDANFAMSPNVTESWRRRVSLTIKWTILPKSLLISWTGETSELCYDFFYIILHKWYFCKLYTTR